MKAKLKIDLKDAYNETYHSKGEIVDVIERSLDTEPSPTVWSIASLFTTASE